MTNIADGVLGCVRCAKPCALVGDKVRAGELCPWCRAEETPGASALRDRELRAGERERIAKVFAEMESDPGDWVARVIRAMGDAL